MRYSDAIEGLLPSEMMLLAGLVGNEGEEVKIGLVGGRDGGLVGEGKRGR